MDNSIMQANCGRLQLARDTAVASYQKGMSQEKVVLMDELINIRAKYEMLKQQHMAMRQELTYLRNLDRGMPPPPHSQLQHQRQQQGSSSRRTSQEFHGVVRVFLNMDLRSAHFV